MDAEVHVNGVKIKHPIYHYGIFAYVMQIMRTKRNEWGIKWTNCHLEKDDNPETVLPKTDEAMSLYPGKKERILVTSAPSTRIHRLSDVLFHPVLMQPKQLSPGDEITITLHKAEDKFISVGLGDALQTKINNIKMVVKRYELKPEVQARILKYPVIKYPVTMYQEIPFSIPAGQLCFERNTLIHQGQSPSHIICVFIDTDAYLGDKEHSMLNFQHMNMDYIYLEQNNTEIPSGGYKGLHLGKDDCRYGYARRPWEDYCRAVQQLSPDNDEIMPYNTWIKGGQTIFIFDMTAESKMKGLDSGEFSETNTAPIGIKMKFNVATAKTMTMLLFCGYDKTIKLDHIKKKVNYDWL